jgi:hypothetical protein
LAKDHLFQSIEDKKDNSIPFLKQSTAIDREKYKKASDEFICKKPDRKLNLSFLISRLHDHMRIVDYRLGQYKLKCSIFDEFASERNIKKVFTLVEKQDSNSWRTVGFSREAVVPGYFRNADAYLMSRVYDNNGAPITGGLAKLVHDKGVEFDEPAPPQKRPNGLRPVIVDDSARINDIINNDEIHYSYNTYGKGVAHPLLIIESKIGRRTIWVAGEINDAFGHAKIDILSEPKAPRERKFLVWKLFILMEELAKNYNVSCVFGFSLVDDKTIGQIYTDAGFKVTGQLTKHMKTANGKRSDAYMWHRRITPEHIRKSPDAVVE